MILEYTSNTHVYHIGQLVYKIPINVSYTDLCISLYTTRDTPKI